MYGVKDGPHVVYGPLDGYLGQHHLLSNSVFLTELNHHVHWLYVLHSGVSLSVYCRTL